MRVIPRNLASGWEERRGTRRGSAAWIALLVAIAACGAPADSPPGTQVRGPSTSAVGASAEESGEATTEASISAVGYPWPEPVGSPPWTSIPLGLPGTAHVRGVHGPLGFLLVYHSERGTVVMISTDGSDWGETSILRGPGGEEQVAVRDLLVSPTEYLVVGEAWTNRSGGSEGYRQVLWRSSDAVEWETVDLDELESGFGAPSLVLTPAGLVVAGSVYDDEAGTASPRLWIEEEGRGFVDLGGAIPGFERKGWVFGAASDGEGLVVWGSTDDDLAETFVWRTADFETWIRGTIGGQAHVQGITRLGDLWVAVGASKAWVSPDAVDWTATAAAEDFATDATGYGFAAFDRLYRQGEFAVVVAGVGHRWAMAWCYEDPFDCRGSIPTVIVTPNGRDWRHLPLPGAMDQPDHPVEAHGFPVEGRLGVIHSADGQAMLSILESVDNAIPISDGATPDIPFEVVGPGDTIEPGVEYGYPVWTHCGMPPIGPLNGVHWVPVAAEPSGLPNPLEREPPGTETLLGFIVLVDEGEIEYRHGGRAIARYLPDSDHQPVLCI